MAAARFRPGGHCGLPALLEQHGVEPGPVAAVARNDRTGYLTVVDRRELICWRTQPATAIQPTRDEQTQSAPTGFVKRRAWLSAPQAAWAGAQLPAACCCP